MKFYVYYSLSGRKIDSFNYKERNLSFRFPGNLPKTSCVEYKIELREMGGYPTSNSNLSLPEASHLSHSLII
jgi:hypothetical protein